MKLIVKNTQILKIFHYWIEYLVKYFDTIYQHVEKRRERIVSISSIECKHIDCEGPADPQED